MFTVGSLFSGAGGFDLGFDRAGFRFCWQVEIDPTARRVLARHWPATERFRDVVGMSRIPRRFGPWQDRWGYPDVIVGGFPCQDVSVAGNREGLAGRRSGLWWHMLRVINGLRPRFVVWENVPGLASSDGGRDFQRVVGSLADRGYFGCVRTLDLQHFGVPQRRRRLFGVFATAQFGARNRGRLDFAASREDAGRLVEVCAEILALGDVSGGDSPTGREAGAEVAGTLGGGTAGRGWNDDPDRAGAFVVSQAGEVAPTLTPGFRRASGNAGGMNMIAGSLKATFGKSRAGVDEATSCPLVAFGGGVNAERAVDTALSAKGGVGRQDFDTETFIVNSATSCATESHARPADVARCLDGTGSFANAQGGTIAIQCHGSNVGPMGTLRKGDGGVTSGVPVVFNWQSGGDCRLGLSESAVPTLQAQQTPAVAFAENSRDELRTSAVHPALQQPGGRPGHGYPVAHDGTDVRRLTPTECERLMGWPDGWTEFDGDGKRIKDGPRYRLCGNGVGGPVSEWIARRLAAVLTRLASEERKVAA